MTGTEKRYLVAALGAWIAASPEGVSRNELARASRLVLDGTLLFVAVDDLKAIELRQLDSDSRRVVDKARSWYRGAEGGGEAAEPTTAARADPPARASRTAIPEVAPSAARTDPSAKAPRTAKPDVAPSVAAAPRPAREVESDAPARTGETPSAKAPRTAKPDVAPSAAAAPRPAREVESDAPARTGETPAVKAPRAKRRKPTTPTPSTAPSAPTTRSQPRRDGKGALPARATKASRGTPAARATSPTGRADGKAASPGPAPADEEAASAGNRRGGGVTTFAAASRPLSEVVVAPAAAPHPASDPHTTNATEAARQWEEPALWVLCAIALVVLAILQFT